MDFSIFVALIFGLENEVLFTRSRNGPVGHGLKSVLLTSSGGMAFGICAQFLYHYFELWRKRKAIELHYPELVRNDDRVEWNLVSTVCFWK